MKEADALIFFESVHLAQNGKWSSQGAPNSSCVDVAPPAKRQSLTSPGIDTERGKPVVLPQETTLLGFGEGK